jgi:hypothetical protein
LAILNIDKNEIWKAANGSASALVQLSLQLIPKENDLAALATAAHAAKAGRAAARLAPVFYYCQYHKKH